VVLELLPCVRAPAEALELQAEGLGVLAYAELFRARLLDEARVAEVLFRLFELLKPCERIQALPERDVFAARLGDVQREVYHIVEKTIQFFLFSFYFLTKERIFLERVALAVEALHLVPECTTKDVGDDTRPVVDILERHVVDIFVWCRRGRSYKSKNQIQKGYYYYYYYYRRLPPPPSLRQKLTWRRWSRAGCERLRECTSGTLARPAGGSHGSWVRLARRTPRTKMARWPGPLGPTSLARADKTRRRHSCQQNDQTTYFYLRKVYLTCPSGALRVFM